MRKHKDTSRAGTVVARMREQMARKALRAKARELGLTEEECAVRLEEEARRQELAHLVESLRVPASGSAPAQEEEPWVLLPSEPEQTEALPDLPDLKDIVQQLLKDKKS